jgi:predicted transcriptional regulator
METPAKNPATQQARKKARWRQSAKKWGRAVVNSGMTMVPTVLFVKQKELKITPTEMNILIHLLAAWWKLKKRPFLGKKEIGKRIDLDPRNVQKHLKSLEEKGIIKVVARHGPHKGRLSNEYDFKPLLDKLPPLADQMRAERAAKKRKIG